MSEERAVQKESAGKTVADLRAQLAQHLAEQSDSTRTFDRFMKALEAAAIALIVAHLACAIYVSVAWSNSGDIAAVWMAFPVSFVILLALVGVHGAGIKAFFPVIVPNSSFPFVTGSKAVGMGIGFAFVMMVAGAFWGAFSWGIWTENWSILEPLTHVVAAVAGVGAVIALLSDLRRRFSRSR